MNVARSIASVHATGCVIGDINSQGVLVSDAATVSLIDSDSFQVAEALRTFLCEVGVPEFTPPELQGKNFDHVKRTSNHDAFGLAVLIFQLLFMELCGNLGDAARSGGVVYRRFEDLDAVFESDTCNNLRQVICAFQPPPGF